MSISRRSFLAGVGLSVATALPEEVYAGDLGATPKAELPLDKQQSAVAEDIRKAVLDAINRHRKKAGLKPVAVDLVAQQAGDKHCKDLVTVGASGHPGTDGRFAYHRYSALGGTDAVSENAATIADSSALDTRKLVEYAVHLHDTMYAEIPPDDGHRKNILDPYHTHVGVGVALSQDGSRLNITQEFLNRYINFSKHPSSNAKPGETVQFSGTLNQYAHAEGVKIQLIRVHYEPFPQSKKANEINAHGSYGLPNERTLILQPNFEAPSGSYTNDLTLSPEGAFEFPVILGQKEGIYTLVMQLESASGEPFLGTNVCIEVRSDASAPKNLFDALQKPKQPNSKAPDDLIKPETPPSTDPFSGLWGSRKPKANSTSTPTPPNQKTPQDDPFGALWGPKKRRK